MNNKRALQGRMLYKLVDDAFSKEKLTTRPTIEIVQSQPKNLMVYVSGSNPVGTKFRFLETFIENVLEDSEEVKAEIGKSVGRLMKFSKVK
jgi:hypothetical protein